MVKKLLIVLFSVLLILGLVPVSVLAEDQYVDYWVSEEEIIIYSDDEQWLEDLNSSGVARFSLLVSDLMVKEISLAGALSIEEGYASLSMSYLKEQGLKGSDIGYDVTFEANSGYGFPSMYLAPEYLSETAALPADLEVLEDKEGQLIIKTADSEFLNSPMDCSVYDSLFFGGRVELTVENGYLKGDISDLDLVNGDSCSVYLEIYGYSTLKTDLVLNHQKTLNCPEFKAYVDEAGDLYIESEDSEWIEKLAKISSDDCYANVFLCKDDLVFNNFINSADETDLIQTDEKQVVVRKETVEQTYDLYVGDEYEVMVRVPGYGMGYGNKVSFNYGLRHIPVDLKGTLDKEGLQLTSTDDVFMKALAEGIKEQSVYLTLIDDIEGILGQKEVSGLDFVFENGVLKLSKSKFGDIDPYQGGILYLSFEEIEGYESFFSVKSELKKEMSKPSVEVKKVVDTSAK